MNRWVIIWVLLLSACGRNEPLNVPPAQVPADLLTGCSGYSGPTPATKEQFAEATVAEWRGRHCANRKIATIAEIIGPQ